MKSDDIQQLSAYMDGELTPAEQEAVEHRLAQDGDFRKLLQKLREQEGVLRATINTIEDTPIKPALEKLLAASEHNTGRVRTSANVVSLLIYRIKRLATVGIPAAGLLLAALFINQPVKERILPQEHAAVGEPVPASIADALATLVAGENVQLSSDKSISEILAFKRKDGALCKHYLEVQSKAAYEAIACREKDAWVNEVVVSRERKEITATQHYIPAGGEQSAVDVYIQAAIDGTSLTAEQEQQSMNAQEKF